MNQTIKLMIKLGTAYVWTALYDDAEAVFKEALANNDTVDICNCRFGTIFESVLINWQKMGLKIINSEEPQLNKILEHNETVMNNVNNHIESSHEVQKLWIDIDGDDKSEKSFRSMLSLISSNLGKCYVWLIPRGYDELQKSNMITLLSVLNLAFPDELFDCEDIAWREYVVANWKKHIPGSVYLSETDFVYFYPATTTGSAYPIEYHSDKDTIRINGVGVIPKTDLIRDNIKCLPAWVMKGYAKDIPVKAELLRSLVSEIRDTGEIKRIIESKTIYGMIKRYGEFNDGEL